MRLQRLIGGMRVELLDGDEQGRRENEVLLRQIPGAPVAPPLHRAVLDGLELEHRIGHEHTEAKIGGCQIGEKFVFIVFARRGGWRRREQIMGRSEEHTSELQSLRHLVCRLLLEKKKK